MILRMGDPVERKCPGEVWPGEVPHLIIIIAVIVVTAIIITSYLIIIAVVVVLLIIIAIALIIIIIVIVILFDHHLDYKHQVGCLSLLQKTKIRKWRGGR